MNLNGLYGDISQKIKFLKTTAVRASNPIFHLTAASIPEIMDGSL
jgi:hypothetical protein